MNEKKVREMIAWLETKREIHKRGAYKSPIIPKEQIDMIEGNYEVGYDDYVYCPQCGQKLDWSE